MLTYSTYLAGEAMDQATGIAVDGTGNAYVTGGTYSTDFPTTSGAFSTTLSGYSDAFVSKLNATGSGLLYSTYLGGTYSYGAGIAVDGADNAYVTGFTDASDFPTTPGAFSTTHSGGSEYAFEDVFVSKLNATGSGLLYSTYLGSSIGSFGNGGAESLGIAVDGAGNAYVTGSTTSPNFPTTPDAFSTALSGYGDPDAFVSKLNATGSGLLYSTYLGGSSRDHGVGIAVDGAGNAYVTGVTNSPDFPTTRGAFSRTFSGYDDAFVAKLSIPSTASPRVIVLVHGINGDTQAITSGTPHAGDGSDYTQLLPELQKAYPGNVFVFSYFQDRGNATSGGAKPPCGPLVTPEAGTTIPIFYPNSVNDNVCDSQSDLGLNAYKLDSDLQTIRATHSGPITIIAHSIGGAITRGWLALARRNINACDAQGQQSVDGCNAASTHGVDEVVFFQGAQQGSFEAGAGQSVATCASGQGVGAWGCDVLKAVIDKVASLRQFNPDRPATQELAPQSSWYANINAIGLPHKAIGLPQSIQYYNFYSDIQVRQGLAILQASWYTPYMSLGDLVMLPGSDNPQDAPTDGADGGAVFNPDPLTYSLQHQPYEWPMSEQITEHDTGLLGAGILAGAAFLSPYSHFNMSTHMYQVNVNDCRTGYVLSVDQEILKVINDVSYCHAAAPGGMPAAPSVRAQVIAPSAASPRSTPDRSGAAQGSACFNSDTTTPSNWVSAMRQRAAAGTPLPTQADYTVFRDPCSATVIAVALPGNAAGLPVGSFDLSIAGVGTYQGVMPIRQLDSRFDVLIGRVPATFQPTDGGPAAQVTLTMGGAVDTNALQAIFVGSIAMPGGAIPFRLRAEPPSTALATQTATQSLALLQQGKWTTLYPLLADDTRRLFTAQQFSQLMTTAQGQSSPIVSLAPAGAGTSGVTPSGYPYYLQPYSEQIQGANGTLSTATGTLQLIDDDGTWRLWSTVPATGGAITSP